MNGWLTGAAVKSYGSSFVIGREKIKYRLRLSTTGWSKVHLSFLCRAGGGGWVVGWGGRGGAVGWICIHGLDPWENVSLGCIVSHIRSHLENHLSESRCSSSLSPSVRSLPSTLSQTHKTLVRRPHSSSGWVIVPVWSDFTHRYKLTFINKVLCLKVRSVRFKIYLRSLNIRVKRSNAGKAFNYICIFSTSGSWTRW